MKNTFFTADEHYGHHNIIKYCNRPFRNVDEMDEKIIKKHNEVVTSEDTVYHLGDFTLVKTFEEAEKYIKRLNGKHIFIKGSHDYWLSDNCAKIIEFKEESYPLVIMCHYAMRVWSLSHYNSWQLFGHSHGQLKEIGKQLDVGVDTNNFYPYSLVEVSKIMEKKDDNFNLVKEPRRY
jgi:calcineurin-like phosphoesterase family protein